MRRNDSGLYMSLTRSPKLMLVARGMARDPRRRQTRAEGIFWQALRNRKLHGLKFLRQHPILIEFKDKETFFVADFCCADKKLILEIDCAVHDGQRERDELTYHILTGLGYQVRRLGNSEIERDLQGVLDAIGRG